MYAQIQNLYKEVKSKAQIYKVCWCYYNLTDHWEVDQWRSGFDQVLAAGLGSVGVVGSVHTTLLDEETDLEVHVDLHLFGSGDTVTIDVPRNEA